MPTEAGVVVVRVTADTTSLDRSFAKAKAEATAFDRSMSSAGNSLNNGIGKTASVAAQGVVALSTAMNVVSGYAATNLISRQLQLTKAFTGWGGVLGETADAVKLLTYNTKLLSYQTKLLEGPKEAAMPNFKPYDGAAASLGQLVPVAAKAEEATAGVAESMESAALMSGRAAFAIGGLTAGMAAYGLIALHSVVSTNESIELSLMGIGRLSGATVQDIRNVAEATSTWSGLTIGAARDVASTLAHAGVSVQNLKPATSIVRDFSLVLGVDVPQAAKIMAQGLGGSAQTMEQMLQSVGALTYENKKLIDSLMATGDSASAQSIAINAVAKATKGASEQAGFFHNAWNVTKNVFSGATNAIDNFLVSVTTVGMTTEQQIVRLEAMRDSITRGRPIELIGEQQRRVLDEVNGRLDQLLIKKRAFEAQGTTAQDEKAMLLGGLATEEAVPEDKHLRDLQDRLVALQRGFQAYKNTADEAFNPATVDNYNLAIARTGTAIDQAKLGLLGFTTQLQKIREQQILARTPEQHAAAAAAAAELRYLKQGVSAQEAKTQSQKDYSNALLQTNVQIQRQNEMQLLQASQDTRLSQVQLDNVGKIATEQQRIVALTQARFQAEQDSLRIYGDTAHVDEKKLAALEAQINAQAKLNQLRAAATQRDDLMFQLQQLGRTDTQQQVFQQLRSVGVDINTMEGQINAQLIQTIEYFKQARDASTEFLGGFIKDMLHGQNVTQALGNALARLADRLVDMATNQLISGLFGSLIKGVLGGGIGGPASLIGAVLGGGKGGPGGSIFHAGGLVGSTGAPERRITRLHSGADLASDEVFAILQKGEKVVPRNQNQSTVQPIVINQTFNNTDPSMRAWITQQQQLWAKQVRAQTPGDVGKYKSNNPGYLAGVTV